ncbi:molecular chaperone IbpA [Acinetobacter johnsonii]|uniref:Hsp20 family protein n=1 Tax=Acinetobacter johnsonii TaxID=40214 RepID=UPI001618C536|nr:Hsp20 family protein [Acinetobacter johnsonii]MBB4808354.1 molecular chaperone IbpA [Acinetobacter johnsonii]
MSNLSLMPLFRRSIGFDRLNDLFDHAMLSEAPHYPAYNIEKVGNDHYRIVVAATGFNQDELTIDLENQVLNISGQHADQTKDNHAEFLHKGITQRSFKLSLRLDEHIEVQEANYENGLLTIQLQRIVPEEKAPCRIPIRQKKLTTENTTA